MSSTNVYQTPTLSQAPVLVTHSPAFSKSALRVLSTFHPRSDAVRSLATQKGLGRNLKPYEVLSRPSWEKRAGGLEWRMEAWSGMEAQFWKKKITFPTYLGWWPEIFVGCAAVLYGMVKSQLASKCYLSVAPERSLALEPLASMLTVLFHFLPSAPLPPGLLTAPGCAADVTS